LERAPCSCGEPSRSVNTTIGAPGNEKPSGVRGRQGLRILRAARRQYDADSCSVLIDGHSTNFGGIRASGTDSRLLTERHEGPRGRSRPESDALTWREGGGDNDSRRATAGLRVDLRLVARVDLRADEAAWRRRAARRGHSRAIHGERRGAIYCANAGPSGIDLSARTTR